MSRADTSFELFYPLDEFYSAYGHVFPKIEKIEGDAMPEPYRTLLVHDGDMTPTLEQFHGSRISLKLFDKHVNGQRFSRRVALVLDSTGTSVEFGAIMINLELFPEEAQQHILDCQRPLGTILNEDVIDHQSHPAAYFRVRSDDLINETLDLQGELLLYGRQNVLTNKAGEALAEVIEILPPLDQPAG